MEGYIGEVRLFAGNFAPRAWAYCQGQTLAISTNTALFSLIGTIYGGDGRTTFMLPDTRSRVVLGAGHGAGLTQRDLGAKGGEERVTLTASTMPSHYHILSTAGLHATVVPGAFADTGTTDDPAGAVFAAHDAGAKVYGANVDSNMAAATVTIQGSLTASHTGGSQAHNNLMPISTLSYIICVQGIFPSRN